MAFCNECGTNLNGASVCPNCGANTTVVVQSGTANVLAGGDVRQNTLAEFQKLLEYFGQKQAAYNEFDELYAEAQERSGKIYGVWTVIGIGAIVFGVTNILVMILGIIILIVSSTSKNNNKQRLEVVQARLVELETELVDYYNAYVNCPIGLEYVRPDVLFALNELVRNGRATTISEAINIFVADAKQEEMLQLQREAAESAKEAAKSAKRTASYSTASFWLKR